MSEVPFRRVAVVVHPTRPIEKAMATLRQWTSEHALELVQLPSDGSREVAPAGAVGAADLVVALGGDGTVLAALRAAAATNTPVLGVACGSLGALSAVMATELGAALDRFRSGAWTVRPLARLAVEGESGSDWAVNDFVVVRRGAGQVAVDVFIDDELYVRMAGDGLIVATPVGSSAYSMAAGGAILAGDTPAYLCTPLAMHGGNAPPLVVPADATLAITVHPGYAGFEIEIDGHRRPSGGQRFRFDLEPAKLGLVTFTPAGRGLTALRRRGLVMDSPRIRARAARNSY